MRDVRLQTMASSRTRAGDAKAIKALEVKLSLAVPVAQHAPVGERSCAGKAGKYDSGPSRLLIGHPPKFCFL